jgi:pilus assembly protein Flp/PilA
MRSLQHHLKNFLRQEDGPTSVEYTVMRSLRITVCVGAVSTLGGNTNRTFVSAAKAIKVSSS